MRMVTLKSNSYLNKKNKVIVITGTPGVGKTVVSKALATKLGALYISLGNLVKDEKLINDFDRTRGSIIADLKRLTKRIKEIIYNVETDVIIEGHYVQDVVPSSMVSHVFVLRRHPEKLKAEYEARGYHEKKILENLTSEILDVCLVSAIEKYGLERIDEINVAEMDTKDVVEEVLKVLDGRRKSKVGLVDWLSKLEQNGRLDEILDELGRI